MNIQTITLATPQGPVKVPAAVLEVFATHAIHNHTDGEEKPTYNITHIPTGMAMCVGFKRASDAYAITQKLVRTLTPEQLEKFNFSDPKKAPRQLGKTIAKYLQAAKRCENNRELEAMVGVFYRDRENAERLRMRINPEANTLMDDKAVGSEKLTGDLILGRVRLA